MLVLSTAKFAIRYPPSHRLDAFQISRRPLSTLAACQGALARHRTSIAAAVRTILPRGAELLDRAVAKLFSLVVMGAIAWGGSVVVRGVTHTLQTMAHGAGWSVLLPTPIR